MANPLFPLLTVILLLLILLLGIVGFIAYLLLKNSRQTRDADISYFCKLHPGIKSTGLCAICEQPFCADCLKEHEKLFFCPEHYDLFLAHKWTDVLTIRTNPNEPYKTAFLYNFKKQLWEQDNIPTYIITHYKIDVEQDHIESYVKLFARQDNQELLKKLIENYEVVPQ